MTSWKGKQFFLTDVEQRLKIQDNKNSNDQNSNHALQGPAEQSKAIWTFQKPHFDNLRFLYWTLSDQGHLYLCICVFVMSWYFC